MNRKKLVATTLVVAMALSTVGYVYAAWTDMVEIHGRVEMGSLTLAWDWFEPPTCLEKHIPPGGTQLVDGEYLGKDVANCTAYLDLTTYVYDEHTGKNGTKRFIIEVENAYPQLYVHTTYILHNIGTIPAWVYGLEFKGQKFDYKGNLVCALVYNSTEGGLFEDYNDNGLLDADENIVINLEWVNGLPDQFDPNIPNKGEFDMHFKQEAQQCHTYKIWVGIEGIQWNKQEEA